MTFNGTLSVTGWEKCMGRGESRDGTGRVRGDECGRREAVVEMDYDAEIDDNTPYLPTISESSILNSPNYANI